MENSVLSTEQILGLEPISKEELAAAIREAEKDFEEGRYHEVPKTYAEFRKVFGLDEKLERAKKREKIKA